MTSPNRRPSQLRIATRGSKLALKQTDLVAASLRRFHPSLEIEVVPVTTTGDRDNRPYGEIGGKGLFMTEVEREVVEGRADVAVHSAKDLTSELADGCEILCVPRRAASHDVVVGGVVGDGATKLGSLGRDAKVGTSSMRRRALLAEVRPDLEVVELRGNLDTRLAKVERGDVDAAILAAAGIERLGADVATGALDPDAWVPAPAQGALAIESRSGRDDLIELFGPLEDAVSRAEVTAERAFAASLEGGCSVPLGCRAVVAGGQIVVNGYLAWPDGSQAFRDRISGSPNDAESLGRELGLAIRSCGGDELLEELREEDLPSPQAP
ncbi:MAG: hydroxymethylbilane synthase [Actinobacteria bacterium]|nr:hydroxymethylbilane synthase [Actinomycetota bacterium]